MEGPTPAAATDDSPAVSIVVPTLNEAANLPILLERIAAAMAGRAYEVLVVDDCSEDGTDKVCATLAALYPLKLLVRRQATGGLSGAVLYGFARSRGGVLAVIDADLQHPPERLPALLEPLLCGRADFVVGSRHAPGGHVVDQWGLLRRLASRVATILAMPLCGAVHDPMSGFFALRREAYLRARGLSPLGYKIGLELMCKCGVRRVVEVPIEFGVRMRGRSKLTLRQQLDYLKHLGRLYDFRYPRVTSVARAMLGVARPPAVTLSRGPGAAAAAHSGTGAPGGSRVSFWEVAPPGAQPLDARRSCDDAPAATHADHPGGQATGRPGGCAGEYDTAPAARPPPVGSRRRRARVADCPDDSRC